MASHSKIVIQLTEGLLTLHVVRTLWTATQHAQFLVVDYESFAAVLLVPDKVGPRRGFSCP